MMTIDLTTAKSGYTAHFRCGGSLKLVRDCERTYRNKELHVTIWLNSFYGQQYNIDGKILEADELPFDIIRIEPAAFDWNSVKRGMAFRLNGRNGEDDIYFYIGEHLHDDGRAVFECNEGNFAYDGFSKKNVTRAPEHDMEVVK